MTAPDGFQTSTAARTAFQRVAASGANQSLSRSQVISAEVLGVSPNPPPAYGMDLQGASLIPIDEAPPRGRRKARAAGKGRESAATKSQAKAPGPNARF
jgi:hypothetical protein